jgi:hypothetical protein
MKYALEYKPPRTEKTTQSTNKIELLGLHGSEDVYFDLSYGNVCSDTWVLAV